MPNAVGSLSGELFVSDQDEVLRLDADGTFTRVLGVPVGSPSGPFVDGSAAMRTNVDDADGLAFDGGGDLFVAGFADKVLLEVSPSGTVTYPLGTLGELYPVWERRSRGRTRRIGAGDGRVWRSCAGTEPEPRRSSRRHRTPRPSSASMASLPNGIAVGSDGSVYLDTDYGNGYASRTAIIVLPERGSPQLVWSAKPGR